MNNVLIMENNPNIRKLVRVNLVKRGFNVSEAENIQQTMTLFQETSVSMVVLDMVPPEVLCVNLCIWIRTRSEVPIIVISEWLGQESKVATLNAGANDYLTKPFGLEELLVRVRAILCGSPVESMYG